MGDTTYIYGLYCPDTEQIRYVGASVNPARRLRAHLAPSASEWGNKALYGWIGKLRENDKTPELVVLETVDAKSHTRGRRHPRVGEAEDRWITKLLEEDHDLTNFRLPAREVKPDHLVIEEAIERGKEMFGGQ